MPPHLSSEIKAENISCALKYLLHSRYKTLPENVDKHYSCPECLTGHGYCPEYIRAPMIQRHALNTVTGFYCADFCLCYFFKLYFA